MRSPVGPTITRTITAAHVASRPACGGRWRNHWPQSRRTDQGPPDAVRTLSRHAGRLCAGACGVRLKRVAHKRQSDAIGKRERRPVTKPGTSSAGRQFFAMAPDWRFTTAAGFVIENEAKLLQGQPILGPEGDRRGFPPYPEPPKVVIDR